MKVGVHSDKHSLQDNDSYFCLRARCKVIRLIAANTIEEKIMQLQARKVAMAKRVLSEMTKTEVQQIRLEELALLMS